MAALVYSVFSAATSGLASPLIQVMGQNETLYQETVDYVRIELIGIVFGSLAKFLLLVIIMHQWNKIIYIILVVQMLTSSGLDYGFTSETGANFGAMGIAYSSLISSLIVFIVSFFAVWVKLKFTVQQV